MIDASTFCRPVTLHSRRILSMGLLSFLIGCLTSSKESPFVQKDGAWWYKDSRIDGADVGTFQPLSDHYAKDAKRVYHADTYRDGQEYYLIKHARARVIEGADPATFAYLDVEYAKDARAVYSEGRRLALVQDPASFVVLDRAFTHDRVQGYFWGAPIEGSDGTTFARVGGDFVRDGSTVWHCRLETDGGAHPAVPTCVVLAGADPATFTELDGSYARDARQVWYKWTRLDADAAKFINVSFDYGTDTRRVWFQGRPFDADPSSFQYDGTLLDRGADARDARGFYREGKRVTLAPLDSTKR